MRHAGRVPNAGAFMSNGSESVVPKSEAIMAAPPMPKPAGSSPLSAHDLITLNEEIASMARAGLPLDQGLSVLAREMNRGRLKNVTEQLANDLRAGHTLPEALKRQEGRVPGYYAALLAAGIRSGRLSEVLTTLTVHARAVADFRASIISAMLYPALVLILGVGLVVFVGHFVLPIYVQIFEDFKMQLPYFTQLLVFVSRHSLVLLVIPFCVLLLLILTERWWLRSSAAGRRLWTRIVYTLPGFGTVVRNGQISAFTELLGILIDQAVPLPEALRLAGETSSDPFLNEGAKQIEKDLLQGMPFAAALKQQRWVPELVVWMIGFGERQGNLGGALKQISEMYRRQAEARALFLRTVMPPLFIILVAGLLAVVFILGLMGPMLSLLDGLSGGGLK
jgi:general secretion pathway protein F